VPRRQHGVINDYMAVLVQITPPMPFSSDRYIYNSILARRAQAGGREELPITVKVGFDEHCLKQRSFLSDLKVLFMTFVKVVRREGISH